MRSAMWCALVALGSGCGATMATTGADGLAAITSAAIERAEDAERARQHDAARRLYLDAIAIDDNPASDVAARRAFTDTLLTWGELAPAAEQLEAITRALPGEASAWHDLGIVRSADGDDVRAEAALRQARTLAPRDPRPRLALAALFWRRGDRAAAIAEYNALLPLDLTDQLRAKVEWALTTLAPTPT